MNFDPGTFLRGLREVDSNATARRHGGHETLPHTLKTGSLDAPPSEAYRT